MRVLLNLEGIFAIVEAKEIFEGISINKKIIKKEYEPVINIVVDYNENFQINLKNTYIAKDILQKAFKENFLDLSQYNAKYIK